jgi:CubicO group peptidase (beta-lactamase class C family)
VCNAVVLLLGLVLVASALCAQRNSQGMPDASPALRNAISVASTKYKIPGIAAALFKQGQLTAIEVCGVRDSKSNAPVTANTIFEAGSLE